MKLNTRLGVLLGWMAIIALAITACTQRSSPVPRDAIFTQAALTIQAQMTLQAGATAIAQLTQIAANPTSTWTPLPTLTPTSTMVPPSPTATPTLTPPIITPLPCNAAEFVRDITIPDGTRLNPEDAFTKTWRLRNAGACTWDRSYSVVFVGGDSMGGVAELAFGADVKPGQVADISIVLRAPTRSGDYTGNWMIRDRNGLLFGIGNNALTPFWVNIEVAASRQVVYDMVKNHCAAVWSSNAGVRACPSSDIIAAYGFIVQVDTPQLENGVFDNEPALIVLPDSSQNGFISGRYPAFPVKTGDRFQSVIGCGFNNKNCDVRFDLFYSADGGAFQVLGSWRERNEGQSTDVDIDLSFLNNRSVVFILSLSNNGDSTDDVAYWLAPRIVR